MTKNIIENEFSPAPGGSAGSLNYQTPLGTHSSPSNYQDPSKFNSSDYNKYYDKDKSGQPDTGVTADSGDSFDKDVEKLFKGKEKPTIDDIKAGIDAELSNMIHKDKQLAKERVISNMKKYGPKYYTKLDFLNIDDKKMNVNHEIQERVNVLNQMIAEKELRRSNLKLNDAIQDILKEKREKVISKSNELLKKFN